MTIEQLEDAASAAVADVPRRMPDVVIRARWFMNSPDADTRTRAVAIAFFAIRQMFPHLSPAERITSCEHLEVDLEEAVAAGLVGERRHFASALRSVIRLVRENKGVIPELDSAQRGR